MTLIFASHTQLLFGFLHLSVFFMQLRYIVEYLFTGSIILIRILADAQLRGVISCSIDVQRLCRLYRASLIIFSHVYILHIAKQ